MKNYLTPSSNYEDILSSEDEKWKSETTCTDEQYQYSDKSGEMRRLHPDSHVRTAL